MEKRFIKDFDEKYIIDIEGNIFSLKTNKYLKPSSNTEYPRVKLSKNNEDFQKSVHILVAETFLAKVEGMIVNHKDGNKKNYSLSNLEYISPKQNSEHAIKTGIKKIKFGISQKLSERDVFEIYNSDKSNKELSIKYNVCLTTIFNIKKDRFWKKIDKTGNNLSEIKNDTNNKIFDYTNSKIIKNHPNYKIDFYGNIININTNKLLKPVIKNGYYRIFLNKKNYFIHRLIAFHFLNKNNDTSKNIINHKDGNKLNNFFGNLEWCNHSENTNHAIKNNLKSNVCGENIGTSKLTNENVINIFKSVKKYKEISKDYNISENTIYLIKKKKIWKHILNSIS